MVMYAKIRSKEDLMNDPRVNVHRNRYGKYGIDLQERDLGQVYKVNNTYHLRPDVQEVCLNLSGRSWYTDIKLVEKIYED